MLKGQLVSKIFGIALLIALAGAVTGSLPALVGAVEVFPATIYVPDNYPTIQDAVDAAVSGDTIIVRAGLYQEHVTLDKTLILETEEGATIDGGGSLSTVTIAAEGCTVSGFSVTGSGSHPHENAGIRIESGGNTISGNTIWGNKEDGILLGGEENVIVNNFISENKGNGPYMNRGDGNTIEGNTISGNTNYGLYVGGSDNILRDNVMSGNGRNFGISGRGEYNDVDTSNTVDGKPIYYLVNEQDELIDSGSNVGYLVVIRSKNITIRDLTLANNDKGVCLYDCQNCLLDNIIAQDNDKGIYLERCSDSTVQNCTISGNGEGICLSDSVGNLITSNTIQSSEGGAIALDDSDGNLITDNTVIANGSGLSLEESYDCRIEYNLVTQNEGTGVSIRRGCGHFVYGNTVSENGDSGLRMFDVEGSDIHHNNFVDNGENARSEWTGDAANSWDDGSEGNYWSDYEEKYPDAQEIDGTGVWDTPYEIPYESGEKDNYPRVEPFEVQENSPPSTPYNPSPANHATGVSINADLSWTGGDPDVGDTVTYDVYFGSSAAPPLVPDNQGGTTYDPGTLSYNTKYYWYVVATDNHGALTTCPLWDFTTGLSGPTVTWNLPWGLDLDPAAVNIWTYPQDAAQVTLGGVEGSMPDGLLIWHYGGPVDGWQFYKKGWGTINTLASLVPGEGYIAIVPAAGVWQIPQGDG
jgi:parallel beta-helix repeat protein